MRTVRFGIIGGGLMGREFASAAARWCHLLDMDVRPEIVAVADVNPATLEWFSGPLPNVVTSTDYRELLANTAVEAVYCAVPHNLHEAVYIDVLAAGKHLFAEKPFGIDLAAAERIYAVVREHPELLVRCSSQFPFYPAVQRIVQMFEDDEFGEILEVRSSFCHSSDLDPNKPINWKRRVATCGEYGCMGDLGLHVVHVPARLGIRPINVRAFLAKVVESRPDGKGGMAPCETWDNAVLACESEGGFPIFYETKRISPGDTNSWSLTILGTRNCAAFTTKYPKTLRTMPYAPGDRQAWREEELGYVGAHRAITGHIFEFGFPDSIQQMWAAYLQELHGDTPSFPCATPEEALLSHRLFTAALASQRSRQVVALP